MPVASRIPVGECSLGCRPYVSPTRVDVCRNFILLKRVRRVCLAADACAVEWACGLHGDRYGTWWADDDNGNCDGQSSG